MTVFRNMFPPQKTPAQKVVRASGAALAVTLLWQLTRFESLAQWIDQIALGMLAAILITAVGAFFLTKDKHAMYRLAIFASLGVAFFMNWAMPAVGILGAEGDSADLMFFVLQAVVIAGAVMVRFRPKGMVGVMALAVAGHIAIIIVAVSMGLHLREVTPIDEIIAVNIMFMTLWVGAGILYYSAIDPNGMNWLSIREMTHHLANGRVNDWHSFLFLFGNWAVFGTIAIGAAGANDDAPGLLLLLIVLPMVGLFIGFITNYRSDGKDFLKRFVVFHFVVGARFFFIIPTAFALASYALRQLFDGDIEGFLQFLVLAGLLFSFYYTLASCMRKTARLSMEEVS
jgi:hypothetical protein